MCVCMRTRAVVHVVVTVRAIHSIPATTSVAACITALTAVGPSIASGNHECIPSSTLFMLTIVYMSSSAMPTDT